MKFSFWLGLIFFLYSAPAFCALDDLAWAKTKILRTALQQAEKPSIDWEEKQRDCAGLIRYVFRKSVGAGKKLWTGKNGAKNDFVSAAELVAYNFSPLGNDLKKLHLQTGDLLVYRRGVAKPEDAWHLMLVLEPPQGAVGKNLLVYHNGAKGNEGEVRKIWLDSLHEQNAGEWRAQSSNSQFMGVYRWKEWL